MAQRKASRSVNRKGPTSKSASKPRPGQKPRAAAKRAPKPEPERESTSVVPDSVVERSASESGVFPLEMDVDLSGVQDSLERLGRELVVWAKRGRYTKVRFKFRGKPLLPDLPLAAVVAAEGLTFYWAGILRALIVNVAGGSLLQVELINDSEKEVQKGREALLRGELDEAVRHFRKACEMQPDSPAAHLNLGVAFKLQGKRDDAKGALETAKVLAGEGPLSEEIRRVLASLASGSLAGTLERL